MIQLILAAAAAASAPVPAAGNYVVKLVISDGGHVVATPSLTVAAGESATFMRGGKSYVVRLVARPGAQNVAVESDVSLWTPQGLQHRGSNLTLAANGETGMVAFPGIDPASGASSPVKIAVSVTQIR
jgi:hypothetical protein